MSKTYIKIKAEETYQLNIVDLINIAVGAFFGCAGAAVGYLALWALLK